MSTKPTIRRPGALSAGEVRVIIVQRLRGASRAVLCERYGVTTAAVRRIESGATHRAIFASVHKMPASRKLREVGRSVARADLIEARELASEAQGMCAHS
jgi:hypothetical protein